MEAVRSLDAAMDLTRRIVESSLDLADAALRRPHVATWATTDGPTTAVAAIDVHARAGGSGSATAWLHHQGDPVGPISWRASGPTDAAGSPVAAVRVGPPALDRLGDGERVQLTVDVDVDPTTPAGTYHAMVLAIGAEETALVVRIVVAEAGSGSAGSGSAGAAP